MHQAMIESIKENERDGGEAVMLTTAEDVISFVGTVNTPDLLDFLETFFRASPNMAALFDEAIERAECPVN